MLILIGISNAQPTLPSGWQSYQNITIGSWSGASSQYVQQMVNLTESNYAGLVYNGNQANFEFTYGNGNIIPAWIESNSSGVLTIWLNITNSTTNVYLDIFNSTTNTLSNSGTNGIGEAPQLSSTYAQYDDGASVFNNYWNFASAPSGWTTYVQSGTAPTISTSGGLTMTLNTNSWSGYYDSSLTLPLNQIMEMYGKQSASVGMIVGWWTSSVGAEQGGATAGEWGIGATTSGEVSTNGNQGGSYTVGTYYVQSIYSSSSAQTLYVNYVSTATDTFTASASYPFIGGAGSSAVFNIYWLRTRAYPPNGVMPSVSFGAVQAIPPTLSLTSPIVYGQNDTITATTVSGDSLNLYINNYLAGTTTSGTLTVYLNTTSIWYNANLSAGTNYINASDATNGGYTNDTLIITQATPSQPTLLVNGTQTTTITYGGISTPISATNTTTSCMNSQCLWNIYYIYNNTTTLFNQTYTDNSNQFTTLNVGNYTWFMNFSGNTNYTAQTDIENSVSSGTITETELAAFTQLLYFINSSSLTYPYVPSFIVNATDVANDTLTLNASLISPNGDEVFHDTSYVNDTNTTINSSNSTLIIGNLSAGTYTIYFNASDALGAYILNQTNFTITQATPTSLQILFPNNSSTYTTTYNNQNITASYSLILPYSANNTNINPTLYLNGIAVQSIALYSQTTSSQFSNSYTQSGINLTAGTYPYVLNTTPNQNYTSASISGTVTINPASPILYLTVPANFTWNNSNGTIAFGVSDINNQVLANLELNYTPFSYLNSPYNNTVANTTTNSTYNVSTAGIYNTTVYSLPTANYTANSTNAIWQISQTQGNTTLLLNGTNGNYTINDYQTIPINITSTDIGNTNTTLYINGIEVFSGLANSTYNYTPKLTCQTINNTQSVCGTFNITAVSSNINFTNTTQTWYLTVLSPYSNITLVQPYEYFGLYNQIYNTSNEIYALLNYTYNVSYLAEYNLTNITMSFGNGNSATLNASNTTGYASPFYNIYTNNSNINYTIWINATDIYNNTYDVPINITTQISIPPAVTAPLVELVQNGITLTQNYSWTSPYTTTFIFNASAGNFPIVNTTLNFGDGSTPYVIPPYNGTQQEAVVHTFLTNGTYNVTVFTTAISGLNSTVNYTIVTVYPYTPPVVTLETTQGYIHNQSYLFNFTQGTFTGSYVVINWGDGSSSTYLFQQGGVSQQFLLYHYYTIPSTYVLQATVYDSQGLKNSGVLADPNLIINNFTFPSVVSISPNEPWNGANYQSNSYNITLVEGSYPITNLTINWEDSYLGSNTIQTIDLSNDSSGGIIYGIQHTFPFMSSYPVQTTICDIYDDCYTQVMPITLGISGIGNPYLQQQFNNETAMEMLIQEINSNPKIQYDRNPMPILYAIFFVGAVLISFTIIILYRLFKRKRAKQ